MLRDITMASVPPPAPARPSVRAAAPETASVGRAPEPAAPAVAASSPAPVQPVEQAVQLAASALFRGREVEVQGFLDDGSGRFVYRVADRSSGEVLMQSPPEALLRFFASAREALGPMIRIEA